MGAWALSNLIKLSKQNLIFTGSRERHFVDKFKTLLLVGRDFLQLNLINCRTSIYLAKTHVLHLKRVYIQPNRKRLYHHQHHDKSYHRQHQDWSQKLSWRAHLLLALQQNQTLSFFFPHHRKEINLERWRQTTQTFIPVAWQMWQSMVQNNFDGIDSFFLYSHCCSFFVLCRHRLHQSKQAGKAPWIFGDPFVRSQSRWHLAQRIWDWNSVGEFYAVQERRL